MSDDKPEITVVVEDDEGNAAIRKQQRIRAELVRKLNEQSEEENKK